MGPASGSEDDSAAQVANATGNHFRREYARSQDRGSLDEAVSSYREACEGGGKESDYERSVFFNNLAGMLGERFRLAANVADLRDAKSAYEAADGLTPYDSPYKKMIKSNLGLCLQQLFERSKDPADIIASAEAFHAALALCKPGPEARAIAGTLAVAAERAHRLSKATSHLDWAIEAVDAVSTGLSELKRPHKLLGQFAQLLVDRFQLSGRAEDLEAAMLRLEQSLEYRMPAAERFPSLVGLARLYAVALGRSYTAEVDAKQSALVDEIVEMRAFDAQDPIDAVMDLGVACNDLYTASGRIEQLSRAIKCFATLTETVTPGHPSHGALMSNLGNALGDRYLRTRSHEDLERGLACHRAAVDALTGPEGATALTNLGTHLVRVFDANGDRQFLDQAIEVQRASIAATDPESPLLPARLDNLGSGLAQRHDGTRDESDLDASVDLHERALSLLGPPNEVRVGILNNLAIRLGRRAETRSDARDRERSWSLFRQACAEGLDVGIAEAMQGARNWINAALAQRRWDQVVDAYHYFDTAATRLITAQQSRKDKEAWLRELVHVSERAAYGFARHGDLKGAVMCLEHGTARLLSEALRSKGRGEGDPRSVAPDRISFAEVCVAARDAPVVYLCCTTAGSLALIVPGSGKVLPVWLDALDVTGLRTVLVGADGNGGYLNAYLRTRSAPGDQAAAMAWRRALESVVQWEGEVVLNALLGRLGNCRRIVLVAVGSLSMLPWHAGSVLGRRGGSMHLLDRLQVSYAPNAGALRIADDETNTLAAEDEVLLAVVDPYPTSASPLPYAMLETRVCKRHFRRSALLEHEEANWSSVLAAIGEASVFHFAGHAHADLRNPLRSGLTVAGDATLALEDFLARSHRGRLAVLSACETSIAGLELPEESVSLSTGLLQFGFKGVIASQWAVADASTFLLMTRFYALWRSGGLDPSEALRRAQCWLRDATAPQLIAHLDDHRDAIHGEIASALHARLQAMTKATQPFSSPLHWAAFAYWGSSS